MPLPGSNSQSPFAHKIALDPLISEQLDLFTRESVGIREVGSFDLEKYITSLTAHEGKRGMGIDIGGNKIAAALYEVVGGKVRVGNDLFFEKSVGGKGYVDFLEKGADQALKENVRVGLSVAGVLEGSRLVDSPNAREFVREFGEIYQRDFSKLFQNPIVDNDAVAGLKAGAIEVKRRFPDVQNILFVINGSGLSASVLNKGKVLSLEPGHVEVVEELNIKGLASPCGVNGHERPCLERVAGGKAGIEVIFEKITGEKKSGHEVGKVFRSGDPVAFELYENAARVMGHVVKGVGDIFHMFEDDRLALVFHGGTFEVPGFAERVETYSRSYIGKEIPVLFTKDFSDNACLDGAAISAIVGI